jgi:hypothetical protein
MIKQSITVSILAIFVVLSLFPAGTARAEFRRDIIRDKLTQDRDPSIDFQGFNKVQNVNNLDLKRPMTAEELMQIQAALLKAYGKSEIVQNQLPQLTEALSRRANHPTNVFFYLGVDIGFTVGFHSNIAVIFAHDEDGNLAIFPTLLARVQALDVSANIHVGIGTLDAREDTPTFTVGAMIGGAYVVGVGIGRGFNNEEWIEFQIGSGFQAGPYLEFIL